MCSFLLKVSSNRGGTSIKMEGGQKGRENLGSLWHRPTDVYICVSVCVSTVRNDSRICLDGFL